MTGREKMQAAFSKDGTREIPAVICYEGIYYRDGWDRITSLPWWYMNSPDLGHQMAWRSDMMKKIELDWYNVPDCFSKTERENQCVEADGDQVYYVNKTAGTRDVIARPEPGGGIINPHPDRIVETAEEIDMLVGKSEEFSGEQFLSEGRGELAAMLHNGLGKSRLPIGGTSSPLWNCYFLWGFEGFMTMVATEPEMVKHACDRYVNNGLNNVRMAAALGAEAVWIEECFTDMISPDAYKKLGLPYIQRIVDEIRKYGMKSVYYYCGSFKDKLNLILSSGADAISFEESKKDFNVDIEQVAEVVAGRCTLLGNMDTVDVLGHGNPDEIEAAVKKQIRAAKLNKGKFIVSTGSPVTPFTSLKTMQMYCDLVHKLGRL